MADPTYLDSNYVTNQAQGDQRNHDAAIFDAYKQIYGRNPTQDGLNQARPAFDTVNQPHVTNVSGGNAFVSQQHTLENNSPDKLYAKQQADYLQQAPKYYDQVKSLIQNNLGRAATQDELDHFGSQLASGTMDSYGLQQFLQQQPEYQNTQNKNFQNQLAGQLQGYDQTYFQNNILPSLQETYAKQGRSFDSSAFQNAATNSAQQQNTARENFLANLSAQQYGNTQANAYQDYANRVANQQALTNSGINAQYGAIQNSINRSNELQDYQIQNDAYNQYLAKYGKRNNGLGSLIGGLVGAGAGGALTSGNPQAISAGFSVGSGFGGAAQNAFGGNY